MFKFRLDDFTPKYRFFMGLQEHLAFANAIFTSAQLSFMVFFAYPPHFIIFSWALAFSAILIFTMISFFVNRSHEPLSYELAKRKQRYWKEVRVSQEQKKAKIKIKLPFFKKEENPYFKILEEEEKLLEELERG